MHSPSVVSMVEKFTPTSHNMILVNHIIIDSGPLCILLCRIPCNYSVFQKALPDDLLCILHILTNVINGELIPFNPYIWSIKQYLSTTTQTLEVLLSEVGNFLPKIPYCKSRYLFCLNFVVMVLMILMKNCPSSNPTIPKSCAINPTVYMGASIVRCMKKSAMVY